MKQQETLHERGPITPVALLPRVALAGVTVATVGLAQVLAVGALGVSALGGSALGPGIVATFLGATIAGTIAWLLHPQPGEVTGPRVTIGVLYATLAADLLARHDGSASFYDIAPALSVAVVLTGLLQLAAGRLHVGEALKFLPHPVVAGFITGTGMLIVWAQLGPLMGLQGQLSNYGWDQFVASSKPIGLAIGILTMITIWIVPRLTARLQPLLTGLVVGATAYHLAALFVPEGALGPTLGAIQTPLPGADHFVRLWGGVSLPWLFRTCLEVLPYAGLIALQASLDSILTARAVGEITGAPGNSQRTLMAQGAANIVSGCIGGIAVAIGSVQSMVAARADEAVRYVTPASIIALLGMFMLLGPLIAQVPVVVLAGALITIGAGMLDRWARTLFARVVRGGDAQHELKWNLAVVAAVAAALFFGNVPLSLAVGTMLAMILLARTLSRSTTFDIAADGALASTRHWTPEEEAILAAGRRSMRVFRLRGGLFFGTADQLAERLENLSREVRYCVIDCSLVTVFDATGCQIVARCANRLVRREVIVVLAGLDAANPRDAALGDLGLAAVPNEYWFADLDHALEWVETRLTESRRPHAAPEPEVQLRDTLLARGLSYGELAALAARITTVELEHGAHAFRRGDSGAALFAIARGRVEIRVPRGVANLRSRRMAVLAPGGVFGETAVLSHGPRTADALCVGSVRLYVLTVEALGELERQAPTVYAKVLRNLNRHLAGRLRLTTEIARE